MHSFCIFDFGMDFIFNKWRLYHFHFFIQRERGVSYFLSECNLTHTRHILEGFLTFYCNLYYNFVIDWFIVQTKLCTL